MFTFLSIHIKLSELNRTLRRNAELGRGSVEPFRQFAHVLALEKSTREEVTTRGFPSHRGRQRWTANEMSGLPAAMDARFSWPEVEQKAAGQLSRRFALSTIG